MESIKPLPEGVRSSLRSGFIICDLTRVVEELVYNSLDAGATRVTVSVGVGSGYVKVEDDGFGIDREGLVLLGERYATSKFRADGNGSFGSLGETISSISDISLLEIITRTQGRPNGYRKVMKGRNCLFLGIDDGRQDVGTTVIVREMFYNQPVRRRLMRSSPRKVLHSVKKCVFRVALMQSKVSYRVFDVESEVELLHTQASSSPLTVLRNEYGVKVSCLKEMSVSDGEFKLEGYVSAPWDSATRMEVQYVYINSRVVGRGPIHKLLNHLSHTSSNPLCGDNIGKRSRPQACPAYILNLICPRSFYDLIFETSVTSVEFKDWPLVLAFLKNSLASIWCLKNYNAGQIPKDEIWKQAESVSAEKGWLKACGNSRKRCRIQNEVPPALPNFCSEMQGQDGNVLFHEHPFDKECGQSLRSTMKIRKPQVPEKLKHQMGSLSSTGCSKYCHMQELSNMPSKEHKMFLEDISDNKGNFSYGEEFNYGCKYAPLVTDNTVELKSLDREFDVLERKIWKDLETGNLFPASDVAIDLHEEFDDIPRNSHCSFSTYYEGWPFKEAKNFLDAHVGEFGSTCFSLFSDCNSTSLDSLFRTESWDYEHSNQKVRLESFMPMKNAWFEQFKDEGEDAYFYNLGVEFESKNFLHGSSVKCMHDFDHDRLQFRRRVCKFCRPQYTCDNVRDATKGRTNSLCLNSSYEDSGSASWQAFNNEETDADLGGLYRWHRASSPRPQRSQSAPPVYKGRRHFLLTNHCLAADAGNPHTYNVHDAHIFKGTLVEEEKRTAEHHQNLDKSCSEEPHNFAKPKMKETVGMLLSNGEIQYNQVPESPGHGHGNSIMGYTFSTSLCCKWRNGTPQTEAEQLNFFEFGDTSRKCPDECSILDISSGILHLVCDSLIPKSVSRSCLEKAKVLLQVDKKFIPVVAGGTLVVIDQHAADERIRLEELRQKVLSGQGKTITYLEVEKELVLPEMAYQLLHNYAEPIQGWGWICSIHSQGSRSFKRNLDLLSGQPPSITLLAVPCILGVDLTDMDLLEYLEQLAATDGSTTMPPSVLRILNYKACRGAIMFGDTLLPSECSLIVEELKQTSLCFQCAHGRPTTAPLVNLEVLHSQLAILRSKNESTQSWHGLCRQDIDLTRAKQRLDSARGG